MEKDNNYKLSEDFYYDLTDDLGEVIRAEQESPGVYYALVDPYAEARDHEYYLIERNSSVISNEAKSYGLTLKHNPELLAVPLNKEHGGGSIIRYEIYKYRIQHRQSLPNGESLLTTGIYGMEDYPDYFGKFPAPLITPHGFTVRYKELKNGIFAIETELCEKMIAVCYPLWYDGFSAYTMQFAERTELDRVKGIDNTLGYLFFAEKDACLAIFELLEGNPDILKSELIDICGLHNAIWQQHPEYAIRNNQMEQTGQHDVLGTLLYESSGDNELNVSLNRLIGMTIDADFEWLKL